MCVCVCVCLDKNRPFPLNLFFLFKLNQIKYYFYFITYFCPESTHLQCVGHREMKRGATPIARRVWIRLGAKETRESFMKPTDEKHDFGALCYMPWIQFQQRCCAFPRYKPQQPSNLALQKDRRCVCVSVGARDHKCG